MKLEGEEQIDTILVKILKPEMPDTSVTALKVIFPEHLTWRASVVKRNVFLRSLITFLPDSGLRGRECELVR